MITLLYTLIILIATTAGALGGLGGGVIIKPLFDALGVHDASTVGVYSTLAVFTMCIVSIGKQLKNGFSFDLKMVISISLGSLCGGLAGEKIFSVIAANFSNSTVKIIQATLLAICLVVILGYTINKNKIKHYHLKNIIAIYASPRTIATNPKEPGEVIIANLFSLLKNILADAADYDIQGIGIGCTGPLDIGKGILLDVENLPTLNYFPLKDTVEQAFPLRVILDNDANALIYAEALWGAGRNAGSVLGFTLGTGIGCAWINGGKVWRGHSGCAGEVWTSPYKEGILEDYVSGNAVTRLYKEYTKEELPAYRIAELARSGDKMALQVWDAFAQALAHALSWTVNITDPEIVIIGGSVLKSSDLYWDKAEWLFRKFICRSAARHTTLLPAALGDNAGFIGAAALILK